jgi:hypothetical protein
MDALFKPVVEKTKTTIEGARSSTAQLELLMQIGLTRPTEKLAAEWRLQEESEREGATEPAQAPLNPLDPTELNRALPAEPSEPVLEAF